MVSLGSSLPRLRKFLRDPDGDIWTDAMLLAYWKRALVEVAQQSHACVVAEALPWPPRYGSALCYRWEETDNEGSAWFPFTYAEHLGMVVTYGWEAAYNETAPTAENNSGAVTQPWETAYSETEQIIPLEVGGKHLRTLYAAYDEDYIEPAPLQAVGMDPWYRSRMGAPSHYYWWDETRMQMALYPRPSPVITGDTSDPLFAAPAILQLGDITRGTSNAELLDGFTISPGGFVLLAIYIGGALASYILQISDVGVVTDTSGGWPRVYSGDVRVVYNYGEFTAGTIRLTYTSAETGQPVSYDIAVPAWIPTNDVTKSFVIDAGTLAAISLEDYAGGIAIFEDSDLETSLYGLVVDSIATTDSLFLVYEKYAEPDGIFDEVDYPAYLTHYIEMVVLGYAFSADTDGFASQMRDYWLERKKIGFHQLRRLMTSKTKDRVIVRGGGPSRRIQRGVTLPSNYDDRGR